MAKWRLRLFWALVCAIITAWGVRSYLGSLQETEPVLVAAADISARAQVTPEMVMTIQVNRNDRKRLAGDAFRSAEDLVGHYARHDIPAGEILRDRPGDFATAGELKLNIVGPEAALASIIPPEARAATVKVDPQAVLGQHLQKGNRVDVVFTSKSDSTGGVYASLLLQQALVLEIERQSDGGPDEGILVTLLVTPEQAVELSLAKRTGVIDLVLNPPDPGGPVTLPAVSPLKFAGAQNPAPGKEGTK